MQGVQTYKTKMQSRENWGIGNLRNPTRTFQLHRFSGEAKNQNAQRLWTYDQT